VGFLHKAFVVLSFFFVSHVFAQGRPEDTMRAGSGGSAGTTQQGPAYDGGVLGPNSAIGAPDVTAVDPEGDSYKSNRMPKKKPVGTIRVGTDTQAEPESSPPNNKTTK